MNENKLDLSNSFIDSSGKTELKEFESRVVEAKPFHNEILRTPKKKIAFKKHLIKHSYKIITILLLSAILILNILEYIKA